MCWRKGWRHGHRSGSGLLALLEEARASLLELIPENADEGKQLRASVLDKLDMVSSCNMESSMLLGGIESREGRRVHQWGRRASLLDRIPDKAYEGKQLRACILTEPGMVGKLILKAREPKLRSRAVMLWQVVG